MYSEGWQASPQGIAQPERPAYTGVPDRKRHVVKCDVVRLRERGHQMLCGCREKLCVQTSENLGPTPRTTPCHQCYQQCNAATGSQICTPGEHLVDRSSNLKRDRSVDVLNRIVYEYNLIDVGAFRHASIQYTHFQGSSHAGLYCVYISNRPWDAISDYVVRPVVFLRSLFDVCVVWRTEISWSRIVWRLWKLNAALLRDIAFGD